MRDGLSQRTEYHIDWRCLAAPPSTDYIEVVTRHSVAVFIPMFVGWSLLLSWRSFSPFAVMMLFGFSGVLAESMSFGPQNLVTAGFCKLVYGLRVYLPAHTVPGGQKAAACLWHYPAAVIVRFSARCLWPC
ncbi:MAG: hypothetical protein K1Y02_18550 [Candidatus Hydrogenedentes bacterium]|nr:hypothetical protein [Candidatus Hydrogenedentota bacterium]